MHEPGWYPDPAGAPGRYRWWDGQSWTREVRDAPVGLDDLFSGAGADRPRSPARVLGYGTLVIALVVVITGLATATGATFGRTTPLPMNATPRGASGSSPSPVTSPPTVASTASAATVQESASPTPAPQDSASPSPAPALTAPGCEGVPDDESTLSDGALTVQADTRWARIGVPGWLACGQGGRLLAGDGTALIWVAHLEPGFAGSGLDAASASRFEQTLLEVGTFRTLSYATDDVTVGGRPACQVVATTGSGQEPTLHVTLTVVDTHAEATTVIVAIAETDDGEGMRATEEALRSLTVRA